MGYFIYNNKISTRSNFLKSSEQGIANLKLTVIPARLPHVVRMGGQASQHLLHEAGLPQDSHVVAGWSMSGVNNPPWRVVLRLLPR